MFILGVLGQTVQSVAAASALIDYKNVSNEFVYTLDVSDNNIITNQGTGSTTYDGLLYTGESLKVGATQVFDIPVDINGDCIAIYNTTTAAWTYTTSTTTPSYTISAGTYGHIVNLASEPNTTEKTYADGNIHAYADLWFGRATSFTTIVKADIQHFYIPKFEQDYGLQDLVNPLGAEVIVNSIFETGIDNWTASNMTISHLPSTAELKAEVVLKSNARISPATTNFPLIAGTTYKFVHTVTETTGATTGFEWRCVGDDVTLSGSGGLGTHIYYYTPIVNCTNAQLYPIGDNIGDTITISNASIREATAIEIPNYEATMYTNADINPKGQQTTPIVFDDTGRATDVDYAGLNIYGSAYINTQWTNDGAFTITENGTPYTSTAKSMPYQIDDTSAGGGAITEITQFEVED